VQINEGISSERGLSFLSVLFSALATLLCGIGLYGIVAYSVSRRTREIGVRFAVGAQKSDVITLFLRESLLLIATGIVIGIPVALTFTHLLRNLLYGPEPTDLLTLALTTAVLAIAGLLAIFLPIRKAAGIEPREALQYE
jgi:ABC-type antimicrobial peptide transport system permease subunit